MQIPAMPYKILVLAPLGSPEDHVWTGDPIGVDGESLDQAMREMGLSFFIPVSRDHRPSGELEIHCARMKDFKPDNLIRNNDFLNTLLEAKTFVESAVAKGRTAEEINAWLGSRPGLPDIRIEEKTAPRKPERPSSGAVDNILNMVALPGEPPSTRAGHAPGPTACVARIDDLLRQSLRRIFSHEALRASEAAWRGLKLLLSKGAEAGRTRVEFIPATLETLDETLNRLTVELIRDIPSLVIVDLPFDNSPRCIELLEKITLFSETLLAPSIAWVTPRFFHIDSWRELEKLPYLPHYLDEPPYAKWRKLKRPPPARWLAVACNRFLLRYPYGPDNPSRLVRFEEPRPLWISPVWALGSLWSRSIAAFGWPTRFTQWREIRLENLALAGHGENKQLSTEVHLSEERIDQFIRAGVTPLVSPLNRDIAFTPLETTIGSGSLRFQSFAARVTHFLLWCKDHFEKDPTPSELKERLQAALALFWERSGHPAPDRLEITTGPHGPDNRIPLRVIVKPGRRILPFDEPLELAFEW